MEIGRQNVCELCVKRLGFSVVTIANGTTVIFGESNGVEIIRGGIFMQKFVAGLHNYEFL
jgi:hypothetical protein